MSTKELVTEMVDEWLAARPGRSISMLARQSGVGETTLRRIQNSSGKPSLDVIISIGRATENRSAMLCAIEKYYPDCVEVISKGEMSSGPQVEADTGEFLESPTSTNIFLALFTREGIPVDTVESRFGARGRSILSRMVDLGIAKREETKFLSTSKWHSYRTPDEVLRVIRNLAIEFDKEQLGSEFSRIGVLSESVSAAAAKRIQSIVDAAIIEARKVMDDPSMAGENVVSVSMLMQRLH